MPLLTSDGVKVCRRCGVTRPISEFYATTTYRRLDCVPCSREIGRLSYAARRVGNPVRTWSIAACWSAKSRASNRGLPFALTADYLMASAPQNCPVLGMPLAYDGGPGTARGGKADTATVDRIIPELGYVPGNVAIVSLKANSIKSNASPEEILQVGAFYASRLLNSGDSNSDDIDRGLRDGWFPGRDDAALVHSAWRRRRRRRRGLRGPAGVSSSIICH